MSQTISRPDVSGIQSEIAKWGLSSTEDRLVKRMNSSMEEIQSFYDAMLPILPNVIEYLNQFKFADLEGEDLLLSRAALAMCEVDNAVNKWKKPILSTGIDTLRMTKKSHFSDRTML